MSRLVICVHESMAAAFAEANMEAVSALNAQIVTNRKAPSILTNWKTVATADATYYQSLLALLRYADGEYVVLADAADRLQPVAIMQAIAQLDAEPGILAIAGGISHLETQFYTQLAPAGIIMRKEAACRYLRVTEYSLLAGWYTLAQLARGGKVNFTSVALSQKQRVTSVHLPAPDIVGSFFKVMEPQRYCGFLALYDPITLDHYLADAEQFLLFWPSYSGLNLVARKKHMFAKRAQLYMEASRQACADNDATVALHFAARAQLAGRPGIIPKTEMHRLEASLDHAIAEQVQLLAELMGEGAVLLVEDHEQLRALKQRSFAVEWLSREALHRKPCSPEEIVVFYGQDDVLKRLKHQPKAIPGRHFSYDQLRDFVVSSLMPRPTVLEDYFTRFKYALGQ